MQIALARVSVRKSDVEEYVAVRRSHINPAMAEQPGYERSVLLRPRDREDTLRLALLNWWATPADQQRWAESSRHEDVLGAAAHLVQGLDSRVYERNDELSILVGDPGSAAMCSIGDHQVVAGRGQDYIARRRDIANPSMRKAPGFVGISVYAAPGEADRFGVFFQWASDHVADEYYDSSEHTKDVYGAIDDVLTHAPASERFDLLLHHSPRSD
jgi:heme-degrading monooxygenase HmoA